jgi:hypothetical protein
MTDPRMTHAGDQGIAGARLLGAITAASIQGMVEGGVPMEHAVRIACIERLASTVSVHLGDVLRAYLKAQGEP